MPLYKIVAARRLLIENKEEVKKWISTNVPFVGTYIIQKRETLTLEYCREHLLRSYPMIGYAPCVGQPKTTSKRWYSVQRDNP
jgi:hypothetical protein